MRGSKLMKQYSTGRIDEGGGDVEWVDKRPENMIALTERPRPGHVHATQARCPDSCETLSMTPLVLHRL